MVIFIQHLFTIILEREQRTGLFIHSIFIEHLLCTRMVNIYCPCTRAQIVHQTLKILCPWEFTLWLTKQVSPGTYISKSCSVHTFPFLLSDLTLTYKLLLLLYWAFGLKSVGEKWPSGNNMIKQPPCLCFKTSKLQILPKGPQPLKVVRF